MTRYLLDNNVVRGMMANNPEVMKWLGTVDDSDIWLASHTIYESRKGIERELKKNPVNPGALKGQAFLDDLEARFKDRIAPFDAVAAKEAARLVADSGANEKDRMYVAVAKVNDMTLISRNAKDVKGLGVPVLNPYTDPVDRFDRVGKRRA
ncbi:PIN domain protein [Asticcacaulis biprosthecium C19]|uniref:PIN domain protein n=1 Tax=Asticcacaulis biprosthecium C19 TaxID=715226 RepID=F4QHM7_9CAUL|nr:PIN domain-containing protein [Asticcacaulis biprosthecium]EGF92764.1 PIN domain protein [Asticcacaulis biprosthecium C19]